jgi:hypothetical protein
MSVTFPSEVLPEIDWSNPLSEYLKFAVKPNKEYTDTLTDIVTQTPITFSEGSLVWNDDGSISPSNSTTNEGTVASVNSPLLMQSSTDSIIMQLDLRVKAVQNAYRGWFMKVHSISNVNRFHFTIAAGRYSNTVSVVSSATVDYTEPVSTTGNMYVEDPDFNGIVTLIWDSATNKLSMYANGVLTGETLYESDLGNTTLKVGYIGVGGSAADDAAKTYMVYSKQGSFTQEEIDSIVTNPYQIFKRKSVSETEYCLDIASSTQSISIPFTGSYTVDVIDTDNVTTQYSGTNTFTLDGTIPIKVKKITATHDLGSEIFDFNLTSGDSVTSHTSDLVCTLSGFPKDAGYIKVNQAIVGYRKGNSTVDVPRLGAISNAVSKDIVGNDVTTWALQFDGVDDYTDEISIAPDVNKVVEITVDYVHTKTSGWGFLVGFAPGSPSNNTAFAIRFRMGTGGFFFDANPRTYTNILPVVGERYIVKTTLYPDGTVSMSVNDSPSTSYAYPTSIYNNINIMRLCCRNAGAEPTQMDLIGVEVKYDGAVIRNWDAIASNHSAGGQPVLVDTIGGNNATGVNMPTDGSAWKLVVPEEASSMSFDDANGSHYYDFTLGDPNKIHDTIGGYDATITNSNTTKWQPIIPTVSYSLKNVGGDYDQISTFVSSTRSSSIGYKTVLSVESDILCTSRGYIANADEYAEGLLIIGGHEKFNGDFTNPNVSVLTMDNSSSYDHYFYVKSPSNKLEFKNIVFKTGYASPIYYLAQTDWVFNGCGFLADTGSTYAFKARGHSGGVCILNDCVVADTRDIDIFLTYIENHGSTILNNNIFYGKNSGIYPLLRLRYTDTTVYNNVIVNTGTSESIATILDELPIYGSNNIATTFDDSMYPIGTIDNNVSTYFVDHANGDYRINETGQAALAGKGWNGSDIVSWAYMPASTTGSIDTSSIVTGGGTLSETFLTNKYIAAAVSSNGSLLLNATAQKILGGFLSGNGNIADVINVIKSAISSIVGNGDVLSQISTDKLVSSILESDGTSTGEVLPNKLYQDVISGSGTVASTEDVIKYVLGYISANGNIFSSVGAALQSGIVSAISAGGVITSSILATKMLANLVITGSTSINKSITVSKYTAPELVSTDGSTQLEILKGISIDSATSSNGNIYLDMFADKLVGAALSSTPGILIDLEKLVAIPSNLSTEASIVDFVEYDKELGLLTVSANGEITSITLGDFQGANVIFVELVAEAEIKNKELTYYVGNKSGK